MRYLWYILLLVIFGIIWFFGYHIFISDEIKIIKWDTIDYIADPNSYEGMQTGTKITHIVVDDRNYDIIFDYNVYRHPDIEDRDFDQVLSSQIKRIDYCNTSRLYVWQWWWMIKTINLSGDVYDTIKRYIDSISDNDCDIVRDPWFKYFTWSDYIVYGYDLSDYKFDDKQKCPYLYQNNIPIFVYDNKSPNKILIAIAPDGLGWRWDQSWIYSLRW